MGVTHVLTLRGSCLFRDGYRLWANCCLFVFTSLSHGEWLSCSLSPAQLRPLMIDLCSKILKIYSKPNFQESNILSHTQQPSCLYARFRTSQPIALSAHFTKSLPQKDSYLNKLCLLRVPDSITHPFLGLLPDSHNVYLPPRFSQSDCDIHVSRLAISYELNLTQDHSP